MKIVIENVSDGEIIPHNVLLIRGRVDNLDSSLLEETEEEWLREKAGFFATPLSPVLSSGPKRLFATIRTEDSNGKYNLIDVIKLSQDGKFKILVHLKPGLNWFNFEFCRVVRHLTLNCTARYAQVEQSHKIKLVYIVSSDSNGEFQIPNGVGSQNSALQRISLAGSLIQCFISDSLDAHGLGRKTIQFAQNYEVQEDDLQDQEFLMPSVFVFKSELSSKDAHQMSQNDLWTTYAKELLNHYTDDENIKYLAITNVTKYENPRQIRILNHDQTLSMTKGHVALGGGGLALFGSGSLFSWPERLSDVSNALKDPTKIDTNYIMDDSAYRGTYGGSFATTLGALIHELGHTLDLGHTESGIMARGFDDMDRFFSLLFHPKSSGENMSSNLRKGLRFCGAVPKLTPMQEKSMRTGFKRGGGGVENGGSNILEEYQKRKYYRKMVQDCGGAYWSRSCALILSHHKWLNKETGVETLEFDSRTKTLMSGNEEGICVVELRDADGTVIHFEEPEFSETTGRKLHKILHADNSSSKLQASPPAHELVAIDFAGNIYKGKF